MLLQLRWKLMNWFIFLCHQSAMFCLDQVWSIRCHGLLDRSYLASWWRERRWRHLDAWSSSWESMSSQGSGTSALCSFNVPRPNGREQWRLNGQWILQYVTCNAVMHCLVSWCSMKSPLVVLYEITRGAIFVQMLCSEANFDDTI